jgi:plasmid stabilization system protein ParE
MGKVIWSPSAYNDIDLIAEFIARDSVDRASMFVTQLIEKAEILIMHPKAGRVIPEMDDENKRELITGSYRIMYKIINKNEVRITGVVHSARDWKP